MLTLCAVYPLAFTQNGIKWKHTQREYYEELRVFFLFCFIDFVCIGQMSVALYGISSSVRVKMLKLRQYKNRIRNLEHLPSLYCRCLFNLTLEAHCCNCNYWYFARNDFFLHEQSYFAHQQFTDESCRIRLEKQWQSMHAAYK